MLQTGQCGLGRPGRLGKFWVAVLLAFMPLLGMSQVHRAGAQDSGLIDDTTYAVELTGEEVTWSNAWEANEESIVQEGDFETFSLASDAGLAYAAWLPATADAEGALEAYLEAFSNGLGEIENVDTGEAEGNYFSLDTVEGDELVVSLLTVFTEVDDFSRIVTVVSPQQVIGDAVEAARDIEFDGDDAFAIIEEASGSEVALTANQPGDDEDNADEPADDEDQPADDQDTGTPADNENQPADDEDDDSGSTIDDDVPTSYTFESSGVEVDWDAPWVWAPELNIVDEDYESIGFVGEIGIQSIAYLPSGVDLNDARDSFLEGFATDDVGLQELDRGAYDNVSYSLDLAEFDDALWGLFTVYIDDGEFVLSYATLAPANVFGTALDDAKESITIDNAAIYNGVEGDGLQDLIDANVDTFTPEETVPGNNNNDNDDPDEGETPEDEDNGNDQPSSDADEYLQTVRDNFDDLSASVDRFNEILGGGTIGDAEFDELTGIIDLWVNSGEEAADLDVPDGYEDLQQIYIEYTGALGEAGAYFVTGLTADQGSQDQEDALAAYSSAMTNADEYADMLDDLLTDEGF